MGDDKGGPGGGGGVQVQRLVPGRLRILSGLRGRANLHLCSVSSAQWIPLLFPKTLLTEPLLERMGCELSSPSEGCQAASGYHFSMPLLRWRGTPDHVNKA